MRFYEVSSADTSLIWGEDRNGVRYMEGALHLSLHNGRSISRLSAAVPEWDIYESIEDSTPPPTPYHALSHVALTFEGVVHDPTARVRESNVWAETPIDELRAVKEGELTSQVNKMLLNTANTVLHPSWWIVVTEASRTWHASVINFLHDRMKRRLIDGEEDPQNPGEPLPYWVRDVPLPVANSNTGNRELVEVDESTWSTVLKDIGVHDFAVTDAGALVMEDIEAAYNVGDWDALAAVDVTDPNYGWPPVYLL